MHKNERVFGHPGRAFQTTAEGTWYEAPRTGHSNKPPLFADLIERMSPGPYVELFARAPRLGWDSWGNGYELERGAWDDIGRGVWVMLTNSGRSEWWSWVIGGVVGGVVCFAIGRASYTTRRWRESQAAQAATVAHPMD